MKRKLTIILGVVIIGALCFAFARNYMQEDFATDTNSQHITASSSSDTTQNTEEKDVAKETAQDELLNDSLLEVVNPTFLIESITAKPGDSNVAVKISLLKNPGISSVGMSITYSDQLVFKAAHYNEKMGGITADPDASQNPIKLVWVNAFEETNGDCEFATLYFDVLKDAEGELPITIYYNFDDVYNSDESNIKFDVINGQVSLDH